MAKYEADFLKLSRYAQGMVVIEYEHCVHFEDGLRDNLRVLIAPQREREFAVLVEKAKIVEEVKRVECQNRDRGKAKRDVESSNAGVRPRKKARSDGSVRVGPTVAPAGVEICQLCNRLHPGECWRSTGACFRCGSSEHRVKDCPLRTNQMQALATETTQPPRVVQQPPKGRGQVRGDNSIGRGQRTPGRGAGSTEARKPAIVYASRRRDDGNALDVITGMFLILNVPYVALIDIGSTHSYVACSVSRTLGIPYESASSEILVVSLLVQSIRVSKLFKDVPLEVQGIIFLADLMELPFGEFNLILGMD